MLAILFNEKYNAKRAGLANETQTPHQKRQDHAGGLTVGHHAEVPAMIKIPGAVPWTVGVEIARTMPRAVVGEIPCAMPCVVARGGIIVVVVVAIVWRNDRVVFVAVVWRDARVILETVVRWVAWRTGWRIAGCIRGWITWGVARAGRSTAARMGLRPSPK